RPTRDRLGGGPAWTEAVTRRLPAAPGWQPRALALVSRGLAAARQGALARVAAGGAGTAPDPRTTRRGERRLANERLDVGAPRPRSPSLRPARCPPPGGLPLTAPLSGSQCKRERGSRRASQRLAP